MKLKIPSGISSLLAVTFGLLLGVATAQAQSDPLAERAASDYAYQMDQYRTAYQQFDLKRSQYAASATFAAQEELVLTAKDMLDKRARAWHAYIQAARVHLSLTDGINTPIKEAILTEIDTTQDMIIQHIIRIEEATTHQQMLDEARFLNERSSQLEMLAYKSASAVLVGRLQNVYDKQMIMHDRVKLAVQVQVRDAQTQQVRLRGVDEIEQKLAVIRENVKPLHNRILTSETTSFNQAARFESLLETATPIHQQLSQVNDLLLELARGLE